MTGDIQILSVELESQEGLIVAFSDGTTAGYVVEELLELRPHREPVETQMKGNGSSGSVVGNS
jgi:hypothetical protein